MTYINLLGADIIIVNSFTVLSALHEKNDDICSDRPSLYFAYEMVGWRELALSMNVGPEHTAHRKLIAKTIGTKAAMAPLQDKIDHQVQCFVKRIINHPKHLYRHVRTSVYCPLVVLVILT
jgi:cytochrome P450